MSVSLTGPGKVRQTMTKTKCMMMKRGGVEVRVIQLGVAVRLHGY